jgi:acetate kinase
MVGAILALNAGSSSMKFALFHDGDNEKLNPVVTGEIEDIDAARHFTAYGADKQIVDTHNWVGWPRPSEESVIEWLINWIDRHLASDSLTAVGHRVVHGGAQFTKPVRLTTTSLAALDALTPLAPLHQQHGLSPVRALMKLRPDMPQIACFDTSFHHTIPAIATRLALPKVFGEEGVRRYGFHGLSFEFIARRLALIAPDLSRGRVIIAHLGNGASLCAMTNGKSIDTTMSFSTLDGLIMGTRCGAMDPGVLLYMLQHKHLSPDQIAHILYEQSGLLGISGLSSDMRLLLTSDQACAREAVDMFIFHVARNVGAMVASLGGLDGFVFTAGIGEHSPKIRAGICDRLSWLGVVSTDPSPAANATRISTLDSLVDVHVMETNEESMIAHHTKEALIRIGKTCHG